MTKATSRVTYHTTPIYYVNDVPHPGHAYTTVAADALARARRLRGHEVFFLTGTDEHGQNIERIAREKGMDTQAYCDMIAARFRQLWDKLDVRYDRFIRTTDPVHKRGVLALWSRLRGAQSPQGPAVFRSTYAGWYCPRCEAFKDEDELKEPGHLCPDHERPCEWTEEENFFFRLSAYSPWLDDQIRSGRLLIEPAGRRNEVLSVIRQGLKDFSISRARVKWGIPVPEEPSHVFYVWMDALANYITALGFADHAPEYVKFWEGSDERLHFVGKEIIRFHCLYWPAMLHAAGVPVPTRVFAHGWLTRDGRKLSKTTGNTIDPDVLIAQYGVDAFRYFFLREGSFGQDWDYTDAAMVKRYNSDLANDLGNLVSRALTMAARYADGKVPPRPGPPGAAAAGLEVRLQAGGADESGRTLPDSVLDLYEALDYAGALALLWSWVGQLNQRIVAEAPWEMAKHPERRSELHAFLYRLLEAIRIVAALAWPVMPGSARRIFVMLGLPDADPLPDAFGWGVLSPGHPLGDVQPLFPRIDKAGAALEPAKEKTVSETSDGRPPAGPPVETTQAAAPATAAIDIADFARVELRAARVLSAEKIPGARKLLKLQVDLGGETRQIVSGIADAYEPESLAGKTVVLVSNLRPAKLMGVESNGMVLAASIDGRAVLCTFDADVPAGTKVK
ncbi:MAG TPA: methionine--tRNA ligase [Vicinamibacteria bacterium]|nr:methionine--tRNA ligase [Vicinamibacteria bacterium]